MFNTLKATLTGGAALCNRLVHFAMGCVVAFCGLMLALPLVLGALGAVGV